MLKIIQFYSRKLQPDKKFLNKIKQKQSLNKKEEKPTINQYVQKDPRDKDEYKYMQCRIIQEVLPQNLQHKIQTVLSKYKRKDIYEKGIDYMHLNALLYAREKPSNLDQIKIPFQNADQLLDERKELIYQIEKKPQIKKNQLENLEQDLGQIDNQQQEQSLLENQKDNDQSDKEQENKTEQKRTIKIQQLINKKNKDLDYIKYDQNMVIAYLIRKFPESYMIQKRLLHEINLKLPKLQPKKILDFGAGLCPTGHVFKNQYPDCDIMAIEPSKDMRDLGLFLSKKIINIDYYENLFEGLVNQKEQTFDIVNCSFVLEEIKTAGDKKKVIQSLWKYVKPDGIMIYVLPGTATGYRYLNDLRNYFIDKDRNEANIIAPCPHQLKCPLASNKKEFCRFEQQWLRLPKNVFPKLPRELNLIKSRFCYLIIKKGQIKSQDDPIITQSEKSIYYHRIIQPIKRKGRQSHLRLCNNQGKIDYRIVTKAHGDTYGYRASKKLRWGDSWKYPLRLPNKYRKDKQQQKTEY